MGSSALLVTLFPIVPNARFDPSMIKRLVVRHEIACAPAQRKRLSASEFSFRASDNSKNSQLSRLKHLSIPRTNSTLGQKFEFEDLMTTWCFNGVPRPTIQTRQTRHPKEKQRTLLAFGASTRSNRVPAQLVPSLNHKPLWDQPHQPATPPSDNGCDPPTARRYRRSRSVARRLPLTCSECQL